MSAYATSDSAVASGRWVAVVAAYDGTGGASAADEVLRLYQVGRRGVGSLMANSYVSLDVFKSSGVLNVTGTGDDARMLSLLQGVSALVDRSCNRHFYVLNATLKFDGTGTQELLVPDLISVDASGLGTDDNEDRTFETTWATTDYLLLPSNADPGSSGNPRSRPYTSVEVDVTGGNKGYWPAVRQTMQIAGQWGWWRHLKRATETANAVADGTTTSVTVSSRTDVEAGHTLLIDSEQLSVKSYSGNTLTVDRGVNGTTASSHSGGAAIDIYEYPGPVVEATIIHAGRLWRRKDSGYLGDSGLPKAGRTDVPSGLDRDVQMMLGQFRKPALGVGV